MAHIFLLLYNLYFPMNQDNLIHLNNETFHIYATFQQVAMFYTYKRTIFRHLIILFIAEMFYK